MPSDNDPERGVIDGRRFLSMSKSEAMEAARMTSDQYEHAVRELEPVVTANEKRGNPTSVVVKKSGQQVVDMPPEVEREA
jgi:hypothetical protein